MVAHQQQVTEGMGVVFRDQVVAQLLAGAVARAVGKDGGDVREGCRQPLALAEVFQGGDGRVEGGSAHDQIVVVAALDRSIPTGQILWVDEEAFHFFPAQFINNGRNPAALR